MSVICPDCDRAYSLEKWPACPWCDAHRKDFVPASNSKSATLAKSEAGKRAGGNLPDDLAKQKKGALRKGKK